VAPLTALLRPPTRADRPALTDLEGTAMGADAWGDEALAGELAGMPDTRWAVVADLDGELVGYAVLMTAGEVADVQRVAVADAYRRRGIGRQLLDALVGEATRRGCTELLLEVADDAAAARALYAAAGFVLVSRRASYYRGGRAALVLRLELARP